MTSNIFVYMATFIKIGHFYFTRLNHFISIPPSFSCHPTIRFECEPKYLATGRVLNWLEILMLWVKKFNILNMLLTFPVQYS